MAKPDTDDGWYKKSIELEAALDFADFTKIARTILRYAFSQIFGMGKRPKHAVIRCAEIAARIGKPRQQVYRALDELTKSNVLVRVEGKTDTFRFVKDYESWRQVVRDGGCYAPSEHARLTPAEVRDCALAVEYAKSFHHAKHADECVIRLDDTVAEPNGSLSSKRMTRRHPNGCQAVIQTDDAAPSKRMTKSSPPKNPLVGMRDEIREGREGTKEGITPGNAASLDPRSERLGDWVLLKLEEQEYDGQELIDARELCRRWVATGGDPEWCAQAFQAAIDNPEVLGKTTYARKILARMYRESKDGQAVLAPAFCDYRPDPSSPATPTAKGRPIAPHESPDDDRLKDELKQLLARRRSPDAR